ncbi:MAG: WXG100 family type VII secretion target [Erysipelotrichaceae bacterium]|nr:WXG100 family type VII secretion target [Erysipelotrichaceae bacterium]
MNNLINVEPGRLEEVASRVETADLDYQRLFKMLYQEIDKLAGNWGGKDNLAFTSRIKSFEDDFRQISIINRQYAEYLRSSAKAYREVQEELTSSANRLKV